MKPLVPKLLIALASFSVASGVGWFCVLPALHLEWVKSIAWDVVDEIDCGTQICARCGAMREVFRDAMVIQRYVVTPTAEQAWAEKRIGACSGHSWQDTGCYYDGQSINCTRFSNEHPIWRAMAAFSDEHADEFARRFASLSTEQQVELWRFSQRCRYDVASEIARSTATKAGWSDLAACWTN
jgi:hypothetical protein